MDNRSRKAIDRVSSKLRKPEHGYSMLHNAHEMVLSVSHLSLSFGGLQALNRIDLDRGELLALIGPNGAEKTGLLNCINGLYHPYEGSMFYRERDLTDLKPHKIVTLRIARTSQNIELYLGLSRLGKRKSHREVKHYRRRKARLS
jgi:branched-chain amino acid transport system ATP-binding protein